MNRPALSIFAQSLLSGQSAVITGGGSGIGEGIAKALAAHGAKVGLIGRTPEKLARVASEIVKKNGHAIYRAVDVREYTDLERAITAMAIELGGVNILINSAAGNFLAPAASLSANGFRSVIDIDLCGTFNACRASFAHLSKRGGSIVSITATQASVPTPLQCHAGAAKAGIEKLTRDLALEWGGMGIRVNAVAPGPIDNTEGMTRLAPGGVEIALKKRVPIGRYGTIEEVSAAVLYLVSAAGTYITGSTLLIDGGTSLLGPGPFLDMMRGEL